MTPLYPSSFFVGAQDALDRLARSIRLEDAARLLAMRDSLTPSVPQIFVGEGRAVVPICGTLVQRPSVWSLSRGFHTYETIVALLEAAAATPGVKSVELSIDSVAGTFGGLCSLLDAIEETRRRMPVLASVRNASGAAFLVATACTAAKCHPTAQLGGLLVQLLPTIEPDDANQVSEVAALHAKSLRAELARVRPRLAAETVDAILDGEVYSGEAAELFGLVDGLLPSEYFDAMETLFVGSRSATI